MRRAEPERLTSPNVLVLLDEIAKRLEDLTARGALSSKTFTVGTDWYTLETGWFCTTIYNDGAADIYIRTLLGADMATLPWQIGEAPLKANESITIDLRGRKYKGQGGSPVIYFVTKAATATVRAFRLF